MFVVFCRVFAWFLPICYYEDVRDSLFPIRVKNFSL